MPTLDLPKNVKYYKSKEEFEADSSLGLLGGRKSFEYILQVTCACELEIPKQLLTYLRIAGLKLGLLINFNEKLIKDGISRIVNNL